MVWNVNWDHSFVAGSHFFVILSKLGNISAHFKVLNIAWQYQKKDLGKVGVD